MIRLKKLLSEAEPPNNKPAVQSDTTPEEPQKLKINIPDSPFEQDPEEIIKGLENLLKQWKTKQYKSDKHRWREYYYDIKSVIKSFREA
jgi:hypothetical protein